VAHVKAVEDWKAMKKEHNKWVHSDMAAVGLMQEVAEIGQWPHVANAKTSKAIWEAWEQLYVKSQQSINMHYYYYDLYTTHWDEHILMQDYIACMLDLWHHILDCGEKIEDIHLMHALILSLPRTTTWEVIKNNLFKEQMLTSATVCAELNAVYNWSKMDKRAEETEKCATSEQLVLYLKLLDGQQSSVGGKKGHSHSFSTLYHHHPFGKSSIQFKLQCNSIAQCLRCLVNFARSLSNCWMPADHQISWT
jgi:hypothetical protein